MKKKIKIPKQFRSLLAQMPESGMGVQKLDVVLKSGEIVRNVSVYNGEDAESDVGFDPAQIDSFRLINEGKRG